MRSIAFIASRYIYLVKRSQVALSLIVFTLRDTRTHISIPNSSNILSNIEAVVNNSLGFETTLWILDVNPNDS